MAHPSPAPSARRPASQRQRWRTLIRLERWLEPVMVGLGFVWLALLVVEFGWGLPLWLQRLGDAIWVIFVFDFLLRLIIAPRRGLYLRKNWLTLIALVLPALRALRFVRVLRLWRVTRGLRLVRLLTSFNRGLKALGRTMQRRGMAYAAVLTVLVVLAGAAGMVVFEALPDGEGLDTYPEALWWTAMLITSLGSEYWPQTPEGRVLCLLLSIYSVGVFGYLAGSLASFFIDRDAAAADSDVAGQASLQSVQAELRALREEIRALRERQ